MPPLFQRAQYQSLPVDVCLQSSTAMKESSDCPGCPQGHTLQNVPDKLCDKMSSNTDHSGLLSPVAGMVVKKERGHSKDSCVG